ncbi:MAG: alpha-amylase/alpha-mannosidase (GH57 family), partial [Myxococcota bacterium]
MITGLQDRVIPALLLVLVLGCKDKADPLTVSEADDATTTGADGGQGAAGSDDVEMPTDEGSTTGGTEDATTTGVDDVDDAGGDTGELPTPPQPDVDEGPDETAPQVVSAFSADGQNVTVRFTEEVDSDSGAELSNYTIKGSDNSILATTSAMVEARFAHLSLANPSDVDSDLTYTVFVNNVLDLAGNAVDTSKNKSLIKRTVYLNIIWHQHQPLYYEAARDELSGPWVRKHATKDYYDMASILEGYPDIHLAINITQVLLTQLEIYNERLLPFVDVVNNTVDEEGFLAAWEGHTDPFIDLLLNDTPTPEEATEKEIGLLYDDPWATVSTADATMVRWPEYVALRNKNPKQLTQEDFLKLKIFFELAWFDPDFIQPGGVLLPTGTTVDLSDLIIAHPDGTYTLAEPASEQMANRLVAENAKVIAAIVPIHQKLFYNWQTKEGQLEITTTPFFHPILPLIYDTNSAQQGQPFDPLPQPAFSFAEDAEAQVLKAVAAYEAMFGIPPSGMWCGEGSVSEDIVSILNEAGIRWTATDQQVMSNSGGSHSWFPYRVDGDKEQGDAGSHDDELLIVFRNTSMSNDIGFKYGSQWGQDAADNLIGNVLAQAPPFGGEDRLITLVVDGENAWEEFKNEHDGKGFFHALYGGLSESFQLGEIVTVNVSEYIDGNPKRAVPAHPIASHDELEPLFAGSWIDSTFSVWIGEGEENLGWEYLLQTRLDLQKSGLPRPNPLAPAPADTDSKAWMIWAAWEEIYAAEGSDWFWGYGADMTTPANDDTPFDKGFRAHLVGMYTFMNA